MHAFIFLLLTIGDFFDTLTIPAEAGMVDICYMTSSMSIILQKSLISSTKLP